MGQVVHIFGGKKSTNCFVANKSDVVFNSIFTNVQKTLESTNTGAEHIYHQQTLDESQPYFPHCIPLWLHAAGFARLICGTRLYD